MLAEVEVIHWTYYLCDVIVVTTICILGSYWAIKAVNKWYNDRL